MRVHFIAIGGSAMHNLALALHERRSLVEVMMLFSNPQKPVSC